MRLVAEALAVAREIAGELARVDFADGSLRGSSGAWLLLHELGADAPAIRPATVRRWEDAAIAALSALEASFFEGMLGAGWLLALLGRAQGELAAVDAAVLDALAGPWDGGLGAFGGGLAGFGSYGLARLRTKAGRRIVRRCAALFGELAHRDGRSAWWAPGMAALPAALRGRPPAPLLNREGSAAAVAFLAAAGGIAPAALALGKRGARTLAAQLARRSPHAPPGLVHGSGTWALGGAGVVGALLAVARATRDDAVAARGGRLLADLDPTACVAPDASLASGTAGIACVLQVLAERTRQPVFAFAAEHWHRRTLRGRRPGEGIGGYLYCDELANVPVAGDRWAPLPGLFEGAAGTALSLLCAARGTGGAQWLARCLLA